MNLSAILTLQAGQFIGGMSGARESMNRFCGGLRTTMGQLASLYGLNASLVGSLSQIKGALDFGGQMQDLSASTGMAISDLVVLRQAFEDTGVGAESAGRLLNLMQKALAGVNENGEPTSKAFERLGLSISELRGRPMLAQLQAISDAMRGIQDPAERTSISMQIFGRSGAMMLSFLSDTSAIDSAKRSLGDMPSVLQMNARTFDDLSDSLGRMKGKMLSAFVGVSEMLVAPLQSLRAQFAGLNSLQIGRQIGAQLSNLAGQLGTVLGALRPLSGLLGGATRGLVALAAAIGMVKLVHFIANLTAATARTVASTLAFSGETAAVNSNTAAIAANAAARAGLRDSSAVVRGQLGSTSTADYTKAMKGKASGGGGFLGAPTLAGVLGAANIGVFLGTLANQAISQKAAKMQADATALDDMSKALHEQEKTLRAQVQQMDSMAAKTTAIKAIDEVISAAMERRSTANEAEADTLDSTILRMGKLRGMVAAVDDEKLKALDVQRAAQESANQESAQKAKNVAENTATMQSLNEELARIDQAGFFSEEMAKAGDDEVRKLDLMNRQLKLLEEEAGRLQQKLTLSPDLDPKAFAETASRLRELASEKIRISVDIAQVTTKKPDTVVPKGEEPNGSSLQIFSDRLARIGGFVGGGGGMDHQRRTASATERIAKLQETANGLLAKLQPATAQGWT